MKKLLIFIFVIGGASPFALASVSLSETLEKIQAKEEAIQTIRFNFSQEINFIGMDSTSIVQGEASFKKPNQMRVIKKKPIEQITVSNGEKMWVYTPSYKQVWEGNWQGWINGTVLPKGMVPLGNFVEDLKNSFNLSIVSDESAESGIVKIKAVPKDAQSGYEIEFLISTGTWIPMGTIFSSETAKIVTTLQDVLINIPLSNDDFLFKAPKGTEVIKLN